MTVRVGPKGQVVVPKAIRERVGIQPGDEVHVDEVDGEVRIRRGTSFEELRGALGPAVGMADWEEHRRRERKLEDDKSARWRS